MDPPSLIEADQLILAWVFPASAATARGTLGVVRGITFADAALGAPSPAMLAAVTVNV